MVSLNVDGELWTAEGLWEPSAETVGPLCCWYIDCFGS